MSQTVVFPEAVPPETPKRKASKSAIEGPIKDGNFFNKLNQE